MFKNFSVFKNTIIWLSIVVIILNLILLKAVWGYGLVIEDWQFVLKYKTYGGDLLIKLFHIWTQNTMYFGTQISYLGIFDQFFPSKYYVTQSFSILGKVISNILIFPTVFILTKNKTLAILSTIFVTISYTGAGYFQYFSNGTEFWGLCFILLFIQKYTKIINEKKNNNYFIILLSILLIYLSLAFALYRLAGILILIILLEATLVITKKSTIKNSLIRIFCFVLIPFFILYKVNAVTSTREGLVQIVISHILRGNWFVFIVPLDGLALSFVPKSYGGISEGVLVQSLHNFLVYILKNFVLVFTLITSVLGAILPLNTKRFISVAFFVNCLFTLILFILASHYVDLPRFDITSMAIIGVFILSLSTAFGVEWFFSGRKNILLFLAFVSPLISLFFTTITWLLKLEKSSSIVYQIGMDRYLTIPAIGSSIFFASVGVMMLKTKYKTHLVKIISYCLLLSLILGNFINGYVEIHDYYITRKNLGIDLTIQKEIQDRVYNKFIKNKGEVAIYYVSSTQNPKGVQLEGALAVDLIGPWAYLRHYYLGYDKSKPYGCIMALTNPSYKKDAIILQNNKLLFYSQAVCPLDPHKNTDPIFTKNRWVTMTEDKLAAFTIQNGNIIDITQEVKTKLRQGLIP